MASDLVQLDVALDLQRLAELVDRLLALLEASEGDDAEVDVGARRDRMILQPRLGADFERPAQGLAGFLEIQVLVLVDRLLVELGHLLEGGRVFTLGPGDRRDSRYQRRHANQA